MHALTVDTTRLLLTTVTLARIMDGVEEQVHTSDNHNNLRATGSRLLRVHPKGAGACRTQLRLSSENPTSIAVWQAICSIMPRKTPYRYQGTSDENQLHVCYQSPVQTYQPMIGCDAFMIQDQKVNRDPMRSCKHTIWQLPLNSTI